MSRRDRFDVAEARRIRDKKRDTENAMFERIWTNLENRIRIAAKNSWELTYYVPAYTPGLPRYNNVLVARRLRVRLRNRGFVVEKYEGEEDSPVLFVSWRRAAPDAQPSRSPASDPALRGLRAIARQVRINEQTGFS